MSQEIIITREQALVIKQALEGIIALAEARGRKTPFNERIILEYINEKLGLK
jgi:hypothetical protein